MFGLFKRKKKQPSFMAGVWLKWVAAFDQQLRKLADRLTAFTNRFSHRTLKVSLILICVVVSSLYLWAGYQAFHKPGKGMRIERATIPGHVLITDSVYKRKSSPVRQSQLQAIRQFRLYMDSLQTTPGGKRLYDSIQQLRPGLLDSVQKIEMMNSIR